MKRTISIGVILGLLGLFTIIALMYPFFRHPKLEEIEQALPPLYPGVQQVIKVEGSQEACLRAFYRFDTPAIPKDIFAFYEHKMEREGRESFGALTAKEHSYIYRVYDNGKLLASYLLRIYISRENDTSHVEIKRVYFGLC